MRIKRLNPRIVVANTPQCSAWANHDWCGSKNARMAKIYAERGWDHDKCRRFSTHEIDGKPYCRQHAKQIAPHDVNLIDRLEKG